MITVRLASPADRFLPPGDDFRVAWSIVSDRSGPQDSFEIQLSPTSDFSEIAKQVQIASSEQSYLVAGDSLGSRQVRFVRVRVGVGDDHSDWSDPIVVEGGLDPDDWRATAITIPGDRGELEQAPVPMLRRSFPVDGRVLQARLHVTSLGVNSVFLNGEPVSGDMLNPGWTSYNKRLLSASYDVTGLLRDGENVLGALLGDGWYRGRLGWGPGDTRGRYGRQLALLAQLELTLANGAKTSIVSDGEWKASTGPVRRADMYDGCLIDLRDVQPGWDGPGFDDSTWMPAEPVELDLSVVRQRTSEPVRVIQSWPMDVELADGSYLLDGGQNVSGFVRLRVQGEEGDEVLVRHAEVLNPDGSLHTHALRSAEATDRYILAETGELELSPVFTFHGFRYATVESRAEVMEAEIVAISSDLRARGSFRCSHDGLNRLHDNVLWSLRDNFVAIPTDCPQRDERLGWTGDAQAFAATSATLVHSRRFWKSWLEDLALDQHPDLGPPAVVPDVAMEGPMRYGRAGWADAATIVPWALYESYGDIDVLRQQFESMKSWVNSLEERAGSDGLLPESPQFGDWLDPDAPGDKPWQAKADSTFIANAFYAQSAAIVGETARVLGHRDATSNRYHKLAEEVRTATWDRWSTHIETTQTGCAIALQLGVVPRDGRGRLARALAELVRSAGGRVSTGFLGTPLVLPALASEGLYDEAYMMLLCRDVPSWLYQVDHGATTTWERWDAIRPDGSIHPGDMSPPPGESEGGHMLSFNHYAYGAVIDWVYRHLGGISPDLEAPGYRRVVFRPRPPDSISWAETAIESDYGRIGMAWSMEANVFEAEVELPFGTTARFDGPIAAESELTVDGERHSGEVHLMPGTHHIRVSSPRLATTT